MSKKNKDKNIEIIKEKMLTIVRHFGLDVFADNYINGGKCIFPRQILNYYDLDKERDNRMIHNLIGTAHIGFDCDMYRKFKNDNIEFTDEIIKSMLFVTEEMFGDCSRKYDQLNNELFGKPNDKQLGEDVLDEIAEYMLSYEDAIECTKMFCKWIEEWFAGTTKAEHLSWHEVFDIDNVPVYHENSNHVFICLKRTPNDIPLAFELWGYPLFTEDGQISEDYGYLVPYKEKINE